jgi:hypothetical protein
MQRKLRSMEKKNKSNLAFEPTKEKPIRNVQGAR